VPSNNHEIPLELFRDRPELAPKVAREIWNLPVPDKLCWRLGPETVTVLGPIELHLDVALVGDGEDTPEFAIIHEVQNSCARGELDRIASSWPEYVTSLRKRLKCPVALLAFCPDENIAKQIGRTVETGHPGFVFAPLTYWPGRLAAVIDPEAAREWPELVLLSAPGHVQDSDVDSHRVLERVLDAIAAFEPERRVIYYDYICARLPKASRLELEELMTISVDTYEWESDFAKRHRAGGRAEGEAAAVLTVLATRGVEVDSDVRERVLACTDLDQLMLWLTRAVVVSAASELFD